MIASFDLETRGLFGSVFKIGYWDGQTYRTFENSISFIRFLYTLKTRVDLYAFNLEFDLSKILEEVLEYGSDFSIDFDRSLIINGKFHVAKLTHSDIYLRDVYPLVAASLEQATASFELATQKLTLDTKGLTKSQYFQTVAADDPQLCAYLEADVKATYDLVYKLMELAELEEAAFLKCPTVASLAMKIFKTHFPEDFALVKAAELFKVKEEFIRQGYYGGRTEIFKPLLEHGFHYDVNSLYPYVMQKFSYPVDHCAKLKEKMTVEAKTNFFLTVLRPQLWHSAEPHTQKRKVTHYLIHGKFRVKPTHLPVIPKRHEGKLMFPVGEFISHVPSPELEYALSRGEVEVLEVYDLVWWYQSAKLFENFVNRYKTLKMEASGAKRNFAKLIQNSLYGKFGMQRERINYSNYTEKKAESCRQKGTSCAKLRTPFKEKNGDFRYLHVAIKLFFADYIRPQYAVFVTSYARVELARAMHELEASGGKVYYCDTDSIFTDQPLPVEVVDRKEYGKWKLEHEVEQAVFVLPKLYAFREPDGVETLKSKGIIMEYMQTLSLSSYYQFYQYMIAGEDKQLFDVEAGYVTRERIMQANKHGKGFNVKVLLRKCLRFSKLVHKRQYDFAANTSYPLILTMDIDSS